MNITLKIFFFLFLFFFSHQSFAINTEFDNWLVNFKKKAIEKEGISPVTVNNAFSKVRFIDRLLVYDKKQPEFIEKTNIYIKKRVTKKRVIIAKKLINKHRKLLNKIEKKFGVPKEYLVALWGIETSFGRHLGKIDIISALATLSFDKRRSAYFSKELIVILKLLDKGTVDLQNLNGSWAGAHGNFQFMPTSIDMYAVDYNNDGKIDLVNSLEDSFASAANYLKTIGWDKNIPWGYEASYEKKINESLLTTDARKLKPALSKKDFLEFKITAKNEKFIPADFMLIRPDGKTGPIYLATKNYEKILNWNRSLRFAITVGIFADILKND
jgi:membrane-bound lytic murein transglycosylase B